jgi:hypothetical protein
MKRFVAAVALAASALSTDAATKRFHHPTCGYSLTLPPAWRVIANDPKEESPCAIRLRRHDGSAVYTLSIDSGDGGFEEGADAAGMEKYEGSSEILATTWGLNGRPFVSALPITSSKYKGLSTAAFDRDDRVHCNRGPCRVAHSFLTDGHRWLAIEGAVDDYVMDLMLKSVVLEAPSTQPQPARPPGS